MRNRPNRRIILPNIGQSPYKNAINLLYRLGYISGDGNGRFFPDDLISYAAACKIFVCALGYDAIASEHTLSEYMFIAGDIGISKNVGSSGDGLTYGQLAVMFYNVLDIAMMVPVYFGDGSIVSYQADQGKTFRNYIENKNGAGLVEKTGIVTADASTFLYMPAHLKDTQIQIDGKTYYYNGTAPRGYVGQRVAYYVMVDDYEESVVVSIAPDTKNDIHNFSYEEIDEIAADKIKYSSENGACQIGLNYATRYIYNNRLDLDYDVTGLRSASNFVVRTIDNNEDGIADVVFVYQYTDCIVEAVFEDTLTVVLKEGYAFENQKNIQLDQDRRSYEVFTPDGILTDFSAIEKDAVISVAASTDGEMVRIVIGRPKTEGVITQVYEDGMTLDNTDYRCDDSELLETAKLWRPRYGVSEFYECAGCR